MIQGFADSETKTVYEGRISRRLPQNLQTLMHRILLMLDAAVAIDDLRVPLGNRLEALKGDRKGQFSIRVNQKWRICFRWTASGPAGVEIIDYH